MPRRSSHRFSVTRDHLPYVILTRVPDATPLALASASLTGDPLHTLYDAGSGTPLCTITAVPDSHRHVYDILAPDTTPLARVMRHPRRFLPWPRRVRWTVTVITFPTLTARQGTSYAWYLYILTFPLVLLYVLVMLALALLFDDLPDPDLDLDDLKAPERTRWRSPGTRPALDYRGIRSRYHHRPDLLEPRIAYALAVIHDRHRGR
ncbi:hypothetical protein [Streptomyces sp. 4F14]|uniref:hypothetical protein n=1 Tax=Streptomyces sp. 4F14 TaxID=3394380 RepID=UPI003A8445F3